MAIVHVQSVTGTAAATSVTATFTAAGADNLLVAWAKSSLNPTTITVPSGWTAMTQAASGTTAAGSRSLRGAYKVAAGGETTAAFSTTASGNWAVTVSEYSGTAAASPLLVENAVIQAGSASTPVNTPSVTPTSGLNAVISVALAQKASSTMSAEAVNSATAGVTERVDTALGLATSDLLVTSTAGSYSGSGTTSVPSFAVGGIAIFKQAVLAASQGMTGTVTTTASITKSVGKAITFTSVTTTASMARQVGKALQATVTTTASIVKRVGKILVPATVTTLASILAQKAREQLLTATVTTTATMSRVVGKILAPTVTTTASITKQVGKTLSATVTTLATIRRSVGKVVSATVTTTASITKRVGKTISTTVTSLASIVATRMGAPIVIPQAMTATVTTVADICLHRVPSLVAEAKVAITTAAETMLAIVFGSKTDDALTSAAASPDAVSVTASSGDAPTMTPSC